MLAENVVPYACVVARTSCKTQLGKKQKIASPIAEPLGCEPRCTRSTPCTKVRAEKKKGKVQLKSLNPEVSEVLVPFKIWQSILESINFQIHMLIFVRCIYWF